MNKWFKVTRTDGAVMDDFETVWFEGAAPMDAALFMERNRRERTNDFYFTPAVAQLVSSLLRQYGAMPCEEPGFSNLSPLGISLLMGTRVAWNLRVQVSKQKSRETSRDAASTVNYRKPIEYSETSALGFDTADDRFSILQGDIVQTEAAYFYGERIAGMAKFAALNSSCDLVPGRMAHASLLRILPIKRDEERAKEKLGTLLKFSRRDSMYLPAMADDAEDVVGNVISFEGICQIKSSDLFLANRVASLSVVGWRIFASFTRTVMARANPREVELRMAVES